jgi:hypothetical protein
VTTPASAVGSARPDQPRIVQETTVNSFTHVINTLLQLLISLGNVIVAGIVAIELWLRAELGHFGLPPNVQTIILIALALLLILGSLRLFGGLVRAAVVLVLILIAIHILLPILQH